MKALEICAGGGGQSIGLHMAGISPLALVEIDHDACETLRYNAAKMGWGNVIEGDLKDFVSNDGERYAGAVDLVAGGVPCPPFSIAGKGLGADDERDLFPAALELVEKVQPKGVMLENVENIMSSRFADYRQEIIARLEAMDFIVQWKVLRAEDYGVPQKRPRSLLVALKEPYASLFRWPEPSIDPAPTVGDALYDLMAAEGWEGAEEWKAKANSVAPTIVGGSKKHGGPDLGPTRAKAQWKALHVNGWRLGNPQDVPGPGFVGYELRTGGRREGFDGMPYLTIPMVARLQGFPDWWEFQGKKTAAYRQVGNAFPPPVAAAVAAQIRAAIEPGWNIRINAA